MNDKKQRTVGETLRALFDKAPAEWKDYQAAALLARQWTPSRPNYVVQSSTEGRKVNERTAAEFLMYQWAQKRALEASENLAKAAPAEWAEYQTAMEAELTKIKEQESSHAWY